MILANFFAGLVVGVLLGLAVAPVLRSWITWRALESGRHTADAPRSETTRIET